MSQNKAATARPGNVTAKPVSLRGDAAAAEATALTYLYVEQELREAGRIRDGRLRYFTERHKYPLTQPLVMKQPPRVLEEIADPEVAGVVFGLTRGFVGRRLIKLAKKVIKQGREVYFYWPREQAVERISRERLRSFWWLAAFVKAYQCARAVRHKIPSLRGRRVESPATESCSFDLDGILAKIAELTANAAPVPLPGAACPPTPERPLKGTGVYLRTDFWAKISSGGSYGHTCYVARELARITEDFICFMPSRFTLLDELGVRQIVMPAPGRDGNEQTIVTATGHYFTALKTALELVRPAYIYERLCLGNYAAAWVSQELGIPYIVEYNGSEISMKRSFDGNGYCYEDLYRKAEEAVFRQATLISVVSKPIRDDLLKRGIPAAKIFVNPNGADPDQYAPAPASEKAALRRELGWDSSHCVIGFTATFGGWHGIDILAASLPIICRLLPQARILLIGDGNYKHLVDEAIAKYKLGTQVHCTGRIPQQHGARLLKMCDLYISPHSSHMIDSRFFGSPTKLFEYMALAGGIVASDLEQIGQVLSPALRPEDLAASGLVVRDQRAVLCQPGDVDEFVNAVVLLAKQPEVARALGQNAREAVLQHYTWERHVGKLWQFRSDPASAVPPWQLVTDDGNEDVQNPLLGDRNSSDFVKAGQHRKRQWFQEAERHRYGEFAPWMPALMEFADHAGEDVLEIGGDMGTDLAQFAAHGARVTDLDLSAEHLALAQENFRLRGLTGRFIHQDAEVLPFPDNCFDLVYSYGVIHHAPNTAQVVREIHRVLKPGGRAIITVYAEYSWHYWRQLVLHLGLRQNLLEHYSVGDIMSKHVELSNNGTKPLVKVYTRRRLKHLFRDFTGIKVCKRQLTRSDLPRKLRWVVPVGLAGKLCGWNLILKACKGR